MFKSPRGTGAFLLLTAAVLFLADLTSRTGRSLREVGLKDALTVGVGQGLAVFPGLSRSGATIASGLAAGLERSAAARFAFLVSIPAILGAALVEARPILKSGWTGAGLAHIIGFAAAAASGYAAIALVLSVVRRRKLRYFAVYCLALGMAAVVRG